MGSANPTCWALTKQLTGRSFRCPRRKVQPTAINILAINTAIAISCTFKVLVYIHLLLAISTSTSTPLLLYIYFPILTTPYTPLLISFPVLPSPLLPRCGGNCSSFSRRRSPLNPPRPPPSVLRSATFISANSTSSTLLTLMAGWPVIYKSGYQLSKLA